MKKILLFCLAGALALAATSCKDEKTIVVQTITVDGRIYEVKSAFYAEYPADAVDEAAFELGLFPVQMTTIPVEEPDFYIGIDMSESLWGKTVDLAKPLDRTGSAQPYLFITAKNGSDKFTIDYDEDPIAEKVASGSLTVTKDGDRFSVKMFVNLLSGQHISAEWKGTAKKADF